MKSKLRDLIREQLSIRLNEDYQDKYKMVGPLIINIEKRNQKEIASDIRSITGVTIVSTKEIMPYNEQDTKNFKQVLTVKVDGYPFIKAGGFSRDKMQDIIGAIRRIEGVVSFSVNPDDISAI
jgi:hypothetical protein